MAKFDTVWYVNSVGHAAVTQWATNTAKVVGDRVRNLAAPSVGNERIFLCVVAGTTHATTEPTWTNTRGAKTTDNTVTWQEVTGMAAVNGDTTNTPLSSALRSQIIDLGVIVKNNSATHLFICTTAGTAAAGEPTYNTTTGNTTADNTVTWTCIGAINAFSGGASPHARLRNALATGWYVNGSEVYIGNNSAETQAAAYSLTAGIRTATLRVICHNAAGNYPPVSGDVTTGAVITTTGANDFTIGSIGGYFDGITFQAGSGAVSQGFLIGSQCGKMIFKNCSLQKLGTSASNTGMSLGNSNNCEIVLDNTTMKFGNVGDVVRIRNANVIWKNTTSGILAAASSVPTTLFYPNVSGSVPGNLFVEGCDLSQFGSGKTIVNTQSDNDLNGYIVLKDCKLDASVTLVATPATYNVNVSVIRCSDTAGNTYNAKYYFTGTQTPETTIVRTGGAMDGDTSISAKITTTAHCSWAFPFEMQPITKFNSTTGSAITLTVEGIWGGGAVPNNDEIWLDIYYLGSATSPLASKATTTKANYLATGSATTASASSWGGSTTPFKMSASFTPQQKGLIYVYVNSGKASSTFYIDPKITLS